MKRIFQSKKSTSFDGENHDDEDAWNPNNSFALGAGGGTKQPPPEEDEFPMNTRAGGRAAAVTAGGGERPNYKSGGGRAPMMGGGKSRGRHPNTNNDEDDDDDDDDDEDEEEQMNRNLPHDHDDEDDDDDDDDFHHNKAEHIEKSAGTSRLNRILRDATTMSTTSTTDATGSTAFRTTTTMTTTMTSSLLGGGERNATTIEKVSNPRNVDEVGHFVGRVVIPPLRVDPTTIGGHMLDSYPISMQQETLYVGICHNFESTNTAVAGSSSSSNPAATPGTAAIATTTTTTTTTSDMIYMSTLQYPNEYNNRKRSLGLFSTTTTTSIGSKYRTSKIRYIIIGRSTNRPLLKTTQKRQMEALRKKQQEILQSQYMQDQRVGNGNSNNGNDTTGNSAAAPTSNSEIGKKKLTDDSDRGDYDTMFAPEEEVGMEVEDDEDMDDNNDDGSRDTSLHSSKAVDAADQAATNPSLTTTTTTHDNDKDDVSRRKSSKVAIDDDMNYNEMIDSVTGGIKRKSTTTTTSGNNVLLMEDEEISSFPVLICMTLQNDGTGPDIRKLIPLDQLTTIQDLNSTIVQLAFSNGDTIRVDFGNGQEGMSDHHDTNPLMERKTGGGGNNISMERSLDKERFIWSVLQIHAMLCMSVVERNSRGTNFLMPLNVRNVDRAELQYIATINGFIPQNETIRTLLERQRKLILDNETSITMLTTGPTSSMIAEKDSNTEAPPQPQQWDMDEMAYDLMMGNFATRVTLFHSEDERKDAEEILNSPEWTEMLNSTLSNIHTDGGVATTTSAAMNVAERLTYILQSRMRDLEAETCRRLIAWEDEKHVSLSNKAKLHDASDSRDTVDALALASLFKTLESLDSELKAMEDWLQERAAAIKPLTDDCADIEEENRQLEQQWKSYDMLGNEMKRLLHGQELDETTETILKNPASVLVYDEDGLVNVDESEDGIERLYDAGKALLDAIEFVRRCTKLSSYCLLFELMLTRVIFICSPHSLAAHEMWWHSSKGSR